MFGLSLTKTKDLRDLQDKNEALTAEVKGFYDNTREKEIDEYFKILSPFLRGLELPKLTGLSREAIKNAYEGNGPVNGIINYIADNVGEVARYYALRDLKTGEYVDSHPVLDLLNKPNDRFTRRKFLTAWAINRLLFGDAFVNAPKGAGKDRTPLKMYVLSGQKVMVERGGYDTPMKAIRYSGTNGEIEMKDKVFQSFDYNLDDTSFFGTSKVAAAAVYLSVIEKAMGRQDTALTNGGPANIITPAASSSVAPLAPWLDDMEKKLNGKRNSNKNVVLKTSIDVKALGDKPVDLEILNSHKDAIYVLCFMFKLPVDLYLGQAKYENAKEAKKTIYEQIAIPMCNEFGEDLLHYLALDGKYELAIDTDLIEVLKASRGETLADLDKMHASLNELREANGYERIEEPYADKPILPVGVQFGNETFDFSEE